MYINNRWGAVMSNLSFEFSSSLHERVALQFSFYPWNPARCMDHLILCRSKKNGSEFVVLHDQLSNWICRMSKTKNTTWTFEWPKNGHTHITIVAYKFNRMWIYSQIIFVCAASIKNHGLLSAMFMIIPLLLLVV